MHVIVLDLHESWFVKLSNDCDNVPQVECHGLACDGRAGTTDYCMPELLICCLARRSVLRSRMPVLFSPTEL